MKLVVGMQCLAFQGLPIRFRFLLNSELVRRLKWIFHPLAKCVHCINVEVVVHDGSSSAPRGDALRLRERERRYSGEAKLPTPARQFYRMRQFSRPLLVGTVKAHEHDRRMKLYSLLLHTLDLPKYIQRQTLILQSLWYLRTSPNGGLLSLF